MTCDMFFKLFTGGHLSGYIKLRPTNGPFVVVDDINVGPDGRLLIDAGTKVLPVML